MTDEERGRLFVRKERLEKSVRDARIGFALVGQILVGIGSDLHNQPEGTRFFGKNLPAEEYFPDVPDVIEANRCAHDWAVFFAMTEVFKSIQQLRRDLVDLNEVREQLGPHEWFGSGDGSGEDY